MSAVKDVAAKCFEACESGQGWDGCQHYCPPDAAFSAQADALSGIGTVQAYTEWMKGLFTPTGCRGLERAGVA